MNAGTRFLPQLVAVMLALAQNASREPPAHVDCYGDPLPAGAVGRLGTIRFRAPMNTFAVAFSPNGKVLASSGGVGVGLCLWDAATGQLLHKISAVPICFGLAFSPDSKTLFAADVLLDVATGQETRRLPTPDGLASAFSPDGKLVASCDRETVSLLAVDSGQLVRRFEKDQNAANARSGLPSLSFAPDGKALAVCFGDSTIQLIDVATAKEIYRAQQEGGPVHSVAFAPDGKMLASAGMDGEIHLRDANTGKTLRVLKDKADPLLAVTFSSRGKFLAASGQSGVWLWDVAGGKVVQRWPLPGSRSVAISPDEQIVVASGAGQGAAIHRWDTQSGKELGVVPGHINAIRGFVFGRSGKTLLSFSDDAKILEWDLATCKMEHERFDAFAGQPATRRMWHAADLSADGKHFAAVWTEWGLNEDERTVKLDPTIRLWEIGAKKESRALVGHKNPPWWLRFSPDGTLLGSAAADGLRLWQVATGKEVRLVADHVVGGSRFAFAPDGKQLAYAGKDNTIRLWDVAEAKEIRRWEGSEGRQLAFSPDGKLLASRDGQIWSTADGKELPRMEAPESIQGIGNLAFSPSGRLLAASGPLSRRLVNGAFLSAIMVWEVASGKVLRKITRPYWSSFPLAFAPDSRSLAAGDADSTIVLWDLTGSTEARQAKPGNLTKTDLARLWTELAGDAETADRALWTLALAPAQALPFLEEQLRRLKAADAQQVAALIADLDSLNFAKRQKAGLALDELGEAAEGAIRKVLEDKLALEVQQRLGQILKNRERDALRLLRALEALELIATNGSRQVLENVAKQAANPRVADAAAAAVVRLEKRLR
jgi:WD40 repeat protein